jgi:60 kDa SS-A/Ro ribonucleoprotein
VVPFDTKVHSAKLNARDSVVTNAVKLSKFGGGGTNCSMALQHLNTQHCTAELVVFVSDNESWLDRTRSGFGGTGVMQQWDAYKRRVSRAKLVCLDISPNTSTPAKERSDILNVGGFSDEVFNIVDLFSRDLLGGEHWVSEIEKVEV